MTDLAVHALCRTIYDPLAPRQILSSLKGTASQKVHLRRCASSCVIAAYFYVRLIPQDSRALHLELFTVPSILRTFYDTIKVGRLKTNRTEEEVAS